MTEKLVHHYQGKTIIEYFNGEKYVYYVYDENMEPIITRDAEAIVANWDNGSSDNCAFRVYPELGGYVAIIPLY